MVDSINTIGPGWRATDASGNIITDGILAFFDAGTSNPRTVYADKELSSSLGTTVSCNSGGYPVTSGNSKTLVYTGATPYKVRLTSVLGGGSQWEHDNVRGALDTSGFLTTAAAYDESVVTTSSNRAVGASDHGKFIDMNCTAGTLTATVDDANTLGDGWFCFIRHAGTANQIKVIGDGVDTFAGPGASPVAFALTGLGHCIKLTSNSSNFKVTEQCPALIGNTTGMILIADRLSTPPGSPVAGARYLVGSGPTGAWSTFAQHDIAEATGQGTWFKYTPAADCGWIAFVQDENRYYTFQDSAWVLGMDPAATQSVAGLIEVADNTEMEAATSLTVAVGPGVQHRHPGHPKAWVKYDNNGTLNNDQDYGVSGLTDAGVGLVTVTYDTAFSAATYNILATGQRTSAGALIGCVFAGTAPTATFCVVATLDTANNLADTDYGSAAFFGDQ